MRNLTDKAIILTGAGGAIAGAVAEAYRRAGAAPILVDRDAVRIQGLANTLQAPVIEADVATAAGAKEMVEQALSLHGRVDGLVHLVGEVVVGETHELDEDAYDIVFDSNVRSLFYSVRAVLPEIKARGEGFIAGIASREAWGGHGESGRGLFAAAKCAVAAYLRSLDAELEQTRIDVAILYPMGLVDTATNRRALARNGVKLLRPNALAEALLQAALGDDDGRLIEIPVYPPR